jgi:cell division protein FtsB
MDASSDQQPDQPPLTRDSVESDSPSSFKWGRARPDVVDQLPVVAAPQNGDKALPAGEEQPDMQEIIMALVATNSKLDDVVARLTTEIAQAKAAFKTKETAYLHQIQTLQAENAVLETKNTALDSEIHMLRAENAAVNEAKEQYCLANEELQAANSSLHAENTTLRGEIEILRKENCMLRTETKARPSHSDKLETVNATLKAKNASLQKRQNTMKRQNRALRKELKQLNQVHADILPFVRDQYAVALRTLVDGVMYLAGWPGTTERGAFVLANGPRIMGFFGNRFSVLELVDIVT